MEQQLSFFLSYIPIKVSLVSMETAELPDYLGSALRGVVGRALYHDADAYNYLYANRTLSGNQRDVVNPYVIVPPTMGEASYHRGEELSFQIYLWGEAAQYLQPLINALKDIRKFGLGASRYPFTLVKVTHSLDQRVIWQDDHFYAVAARRVVLPYQSLTDVRSVTLHMHTPLRIRRKGTLLESIDFPTIIRNITQRMKAITTRYGGWLDVKEAERVQRLSSDVSVAQHNLSMKNMQRYSNRLGEKMDFDGLTGSIRFEGELTPFVPWLYAAQILHIGRNTTFGMGRLSVEFT